MQNHEVGLSQNYSLYLIPSLCSQYSQELKKTNGLEKYSCQTEASSDTDNSLSPGAQNSEIGKMKELYLRCTASQLRYVNEMLNPSIKLTGE